MKTKKPEQRPIHIALATFQKLQRAYHKAALKRRAGAPKKSEFYTEVIERGLEK